MYDIFVLSNRPKNLNKEWTKIKSKFPFAKYISSVDEAKSQSLTEFYWIVWDDLVVKEDFKFDYSPDNWSKDYVHVFKNEGVYDGICLIPKNFAFSAKELEYRFFVKKKEIDIEASSYKYKNMYDIVFISYQEPNADKNYENLLSRFPHAKRIHGVKGIHQAHIEAAKICESNMFWVVDGDAVIVDDFKFDYHVQRQFYDFVHVWRSQNPINDLVYGYGGVKLLPRELTVNMDVSKPDMTTSISKKFKIIDAISNITAFNTDPYNTWKSAFRECIKLSSKVIDRQKEDETTKRLHIWKSVGIDKPFGEYAIAGANAGAEYGSRYKNNLEELKKINDFDWLQEQFDARNL